MKQPGSAVRRKGNFPLPFIVDSHHSRLQPSILNRVQSPQSHRPIDPSCTLTNREFLCYFRAEPQLVRYVQYTPPSESASENRDTSPDLDDMNAGARSKRRSVPTVSKRDNVGKTKKRPRVALACQRCKSRKQRAGYRNFGPVHLCWLCFKVWRGTTALHQLREVGMAMWVHNTNKNIPVWEDWVR